MTNGQAVLAELIARYRENAERPYGDAYVSLNYSLPTYPEWMLKIYEAAGWSKLNKVTPIMAALDTYGGRYSDKVIPVIKQLFVELDLGDVDVEWQVEGIDGDEIRVLHLIPDIDYGVMNRWIIDYGDYLTDELVDGGENLPIMEKRDVVLRMYYDLKDHNVCNLAHVERMLHHAIPKQYHPRSGMYSVLRKDGTYTDALYRFSEGYTMAVAAGLDELLITNTLQWMEQEAKNYDSSSKK